MKELVTAAFLGIIMTAFTFYLWWLTAIIILGFGFANMKKSGNKTFMIVAVVAAIVVAILGISLRSNSNNSETETASVPANVQQYDVA